LSLLGLKRIDDVVKSWVVVLEVSEVGNRLDRPLDEAKHFVIIVIDGVLDLLSHLGVQSDNLLVVLRVEETEMAVLARHHSSCGQTVVKHRYLTKERTRSQGLKFIFIRLSLSLALLLLLQGPRSQNCVMVHMDSALSLRDQVDRFGRLILLDHDGVWGCQVGLHTLNNRLDKLLCTIFSSLNISLRVINLILNHVFNSSLESQILLNSVREDLNSDLLTQGLRKHSQKLFQLIRLILGALSLD
jgi:hypothetical protein